MPGSIVWLIAVLAVLPVAWLAGQRAAAIADPVRRCCVIGAVFLLLLGWAVLIHHPAVAVELIPLTALARLEGIGAAPLFVFVLGVGWRQAMVRRQRAVMVLGMCLGFGYFVQGGLWMLRPTPTNAFTQSGDRYFVEQSQDYSCVPAACATSLRMLGIDTSEAEMAELTETRAGSGATLLRALNGLNEKLADTDIQPRLLEPTFDQLAKYQTPMLTPLRYEAARLHMVTIIEVRPHLVVIADPQVGIEFVPRPVFEKSYRGQVIAFDGGGQRADTKAVLEQHPTLRDPDDPAAYPWLVRAEIETGAAAEVSSACP
ncbi:MAG: cysteine peptidase family C39 domain-containing protein [Phycisphaeraceae bacterium]